MPTLSPSGLAGVPVFLLDANSISGSDGDNVTSYADLSASGNNLTGSATYPTLKTNPSSFGQVIRFNANPVMSGSFARWGANGFTIVLVCNNLVIGTNNSGVLSIIASGTTNDQSTNGSFPITLRNFTTDGMAIMGQGTVTAGTNAFGPNVTVSTGLSLPVLVWWRCQTTAHPATFGFGQRFQSSAWSTTLGGKFDLHAAAIYDSEISEANLDADLKYIYSTILKRNSTLFPAGGGVSGARLVGLSALVG